MAIIPICRHLSEQRWLYLPVFKLYTIITTPIPEKPNLALKLA